MRMQILEQSDNRKLQEVKSNDYASQELIIDIAQIQSKILGFAISQKINKYKNPYLEEMYQLVKTDLIDDTFKKSDKTFNKLMLILTMDPDNLDIELINSCFQQLKQNKSKDRSSEDDINTALFYQSLKKIQYINLSSWQLVQQMLQQDNFKKIYVKGAKLYQQLNRQNTEISIFQSLITQQLKTYMSKQNIKMKVQQNLVIQKIFELDIRLQDQNKNRFYIEIHGKTHFYRNLTLQGKKSLDHRTKGKMNWLQKIGMKVVQVDQQEWKDMQHLDQSDIDDFFKSKIKKLIG